jgi:hypothetical protein
MASKTAIFTFFFLQIFNVVSFAQDIKLKDLAKIELTTLGGGLSRYNRSIEVINNGHSWNSYQTKLLEGYNRLTKQSFDDTSRTFIKKIPQSTLTELLSLISRPDTAIKLALFNIKINELIKYVDTNYVYHKLRNLKLQQRAEFIKALQAKDSLQKMLKQAVIPAFLMSDKTYYSIILVDKANKSDTIYASSFAEPYNLPWIIKKEKSYNPKISVIYDFIGGNDKFEQDQKNGLYKNIDWWFYRTYFETKFNWDNLKTEQPKSYTLLNGTLTPVTFSRSESGYFGFFKSSRLPSYLQISFGYMKDSTLASNRYKRFEDTLVGIFRNRSFLFSYLETKPGCKVYVFPGEMGESGKAYFGEIKKYFPAIAGYDYKKTQLFSVVESGGAVSKWIILPDGKVILIKYTGELNYDHDGKFTGIGRDASRTYQKQNYVCLVFDSSGNKLDGNNGPVYIGEY